MSVARSIQRWMRHRLGGRRWDDNLISDSWFKGHFDYAAGVVGEWLGSEVDFDRAHIVDFGCGDGITALGVALQSRPKQVVGVDILSAYAQLDVLAKQQLGLLALPANLEFHQVEPGKPLDLRGMDGIYSWSVFEHVDRRDLPTIVANFYDVLRPGGVAFLQIEPLYYSAFGSHLQRLVPEPWAHLRLEPAELEGRVQSFRGELAEEDRDLAAREGASEGVSQGFKDWLFREYRSLNRLTGDELVGLFGNAGFEIIREHRAQRAESPPADLLESHEEIDLKTNEIRLLARKPI